MRDFAISILLLIATGLIACQSNADKLRALAAKKQYESIARLLESSEIEAADRSLGISLLAKAKTSKATAVLERMLKTSEPETRRQILEAANREKLAFLDRREFLTIFFAAEAPSDDDKILAVQLQLWNPAKRKESVEAFVKKGLASAANINAAMALASHFAAVLPAAEKGAYSTLADTLRIVEGDKLGNEALAALIKAFPFATENKGNLETLVKLDRESRELTQSAQEARQASQDNDEFVRSHGVQDLFVFIVGEHGDSTYEVAFPNYIWGTPVVSQRHAFLITTQTRFESRGWSRIKVKSAGTLPTKLKEEAGGFTANWPVYVEASATDVAQFEAALRLQRTSATLANDSEAKARGKRQQRDAALVKAFAKLGLKPAGFDPAVLANQVAANQVQSGKTQVLIVGGSRSKPEAEKLLASLKPRLAGVCGAASSCLKLEFSSQFPGFNPGFHIVTAGHYKDQEAANSALKRAKLHVKDAYLKSPTGPYTAH